MTHFVLCGWGEPVKQIDGRRNTGPRTWTIHRQITDIQAVLQIGVEADRFLGTRWGHSTPYCAFSLSGATSGPRWPCRPGHACSWGPPPVTALTALQNSDIILSQPTGAAPWTGKRPECALGAQVRSKPGGGGLGAPVLTGHRRWTMRDVSLPLLLWPAPAGEQGSTPWAVSVPGRGAAIPEQPPGTGPPAVFVPTSRTRAPGGTHRAEPCTLSPATRHAQTHDENPTEAPVPGGQWRESFLHGKSLLCDGQIPTTYSGGGAGGL